MQRPPCLTKKEKTSLVFPEFTNNVVQPEVNSFADAPKLPGEQCKCPGPSGSHATPTERIPELFWFDKSSLIGGLQELPPPPPPVSMSSTKLQALMNELRMSDEDMDTILELTGEI